MKTYTSAQTRQIQDADTALGQAETQLRKAITLLKAAGLPELAQEVACAKALVNALPTLS